MSMSTSDKTNPGLDWIRQYTYFDSACQRLLVDDKGYIWRFTLDASHSTRCTPVDIGSEVSPELVYCQCLYTYYLLSIMTVRDQDKIPSRLFFRFPDCRKHKSLRTWREPLAFERIPRRVRHHVIGVYL